MSGDHTKYTRDCGRTVKDKGEELRHEDPSVCIYNCSSVRLRYINSGRRGNWLLRRMKTCIYIVCTLILVWLLSHIADCCKSTHS
jgi:hypothetical protein